MRIRSVLEGLFLPDVWLIFLLPVLLPSRNVSRQVYTLSLVLIHTCPNCARVDVFVAFDHLSGICPAPETFYASSRPGVAIRVVISDARVTHVIQFSRHRVARFER